MTGTISVKVEGPVGLDEPAELLADLGRETGLAWQLDTPDASERPGTLDGGLVSAVLVAVVTVAVEVPVKAAVESVVERWRARRLDPPPVAVDVTPPPPTDSLGTSGGSQPDAPATPEGS